MLFLVSFLAFFAELVDASIGMGYGTSLTPILLLLDFSQNQVVPALLLTQSLAGIFASFMHHKVGNVNLRPKTFHPVRMIEGIMTHGPVKSAKRGLPQSLLIAIALSTLGFIGAIVSVFVAVSISKESLNMFIGLIIASIGVYILVSRHKNPKFSWPKLVILGLIASFNKGLSGGGYGPLVTGGQIVTGVSPKSAIAITSFAESFTSIVSFTAYLILSDNVDLSLAPYLIVGSLLSVPVSAHVVKRIDHAYIKTIIGIATLLLGLLTIYSLG